MPTLTFPNYRPVVQGTTKTSKPRVIKNAFGDGYSQRTVDGINANLQTWNLTWTKLEADIDTIESFLDDHGGYIAFYWTPERESTQRKFICPEWSRTYILGKDDGIDTLIAKFEEVSDL
jgi:phage-related protein